MSRRHLLLGAAFAVAASVAPVSSAWAQAASWPTRPVKIVHGFGPGGPVDLLARLVANQFAEKFGQPAVVEGKPGAGGTIGANFVAKAEPDGYTLFLMASGHSAAPGLYPSLPFDPVGDFTMISMVARSPFAIVAGPGASFKTVQEFVKTAKEKPGKVDFGSGGQGSGMHLAAVLMQASGHFQLTHVPYRGGGALNTAVLGGEIPVMFTSLAGLKPQIDAGKMIPLAVTSKTRYSGLPNVPTVAETVLPDFDVSAWYAIAGPKGLPIGVVARVNELVRSTLARPDIQETLRVQAAEPWASTPQEAQDFLAKDVKHWTQVVRAANISAAAN